MGNFNPYLPADRQDIDDIEQDQEAQCALCKQYFDDDENITSIEENGYCVECEKQYVK